MVGWVAPLMAVADGTTMVCTARWSHMASGDGMVYAGGLYHGGLPVMVGRVACSVVIADSTTTNTLISLFMPDCFVGVSVFFLSFCVLNMPWRCIDDD